MSDPPHYKAISFFLDSHPSKWLYSSYLRCYDKLSLPRTDASENYGLCLKWFSTHGTPEEQARANDLLQLKRSKRAREKEQTQTQTRSPYEPRAAKRTRREAAPVAAPASVVNNTVNNTVTLHGSQNRLSWGNVSHSNADASPKSFAEFDAIVTDGSPSLPDTVVLASETDPESSDPEFTTAPSSPARDKHKKKDALITIPARELEALRREVKTLARDQRMLRTENESLRAQVNSLHWIVAAGRIGEVIEGEGRRRKRERERERE